MSIPVAILGWGVGRSMEAEPKPAQVLGAIRRQWVRFRGLRYGQSNLVLEAELRASARAACKFLTKVDNISLVLDEKLPEWMDEAMMKHLVLGEELPAGRDPPKVPEPAEVVVRRRSDASRGFDLFCVVQRDDLRPKAVKLRNQAKFRGKPIAALIKVVAGRSWAKCKKPEKQIYIERAKATEGSRVRGPRGAFVREVPDLRAHAELEAGGAALDFRPAAELVDEVVAIFDGPPPTTPAKLKKRAPAQNCWRPLATR